MIDKSGSSKEKLRRGDVQGKRVTIMGLGLHGGGEGAARFFAQEGARVLVTDLKDEKKLQPTLERLRHLPIAYVFGQHREEDFINTDLIIQNPGVPDVSPYLDVARKHGVPIDTDIGIFFEWCPGFIIGITGTKGKSTVAALTHQILRHAGIATVLAGNIRISALEVLPDITSNMVVVLELSSWQLEGLAHHKKSPHVALITNVLRDHLNRYKDFASYRDAKALIFKYQKSDDIVVLNAEDPSTPLFREQARSRVFLFSSDRQEGSETLGRVHDGVFFIEEEAVLKEADLPIHNAIFATNALSALTLTAAAHTHADFPAKKIPRAASVAAVKSFVPLSGRLEKVAETGGVTFINDTCATIPDATIAALESFPKGKIILIAGGMDKKLEYAALAAKIATHVKHLVLFAGDASEKLRAELERRDAGDLIVASDVDSMSEAVSLAWSRSAPGDVVVLSPASASFNLFANEFERGAQFIAAVRQFASSV